MPKYTYNISDFPDNEVNLGVFNMEISDSSIGYLFSYLILEEDVEVVCQSALSSGEQSILDNLVATHDKDTYIAPDPPNMPVPVQGSSDDITFGTPRATPLPTINQTYGPTNIQVLGTNGPDFSNVEEFVVNWSLDDDAIYSFNLTTTDGSPSWWLNLMPKITSQTFASSSPSITLSGTGINNLDGAYWVNVIDNGFLMHSQTGDFTVYFATSTSSYIPTQYNSTFLCIDPSNGVYDSNVPTNVYGTQFNWAESRALTSTTSNSFINKVSLTTPELPKGMYNIRVSYGWSQTEGDSYFESRVLLDSNELGETHRVTPTTGQRFGDRSVDNDWIDFSNREFIELLAPGEHTIELQYRQDGGNTAKMANATIQLFRVF